jgi:ATP-binding cassette subfamily B protein
LLQLYTGEKLVLRFRCRLFGYLQRLSLSYHDTKGTADSLYRLQHDAPAVQYVTIQGFVPFVTAWITLLVLVWATARFDVALAMVALAVSPALFFLAEFYRRRIRSRWTTVKELESATMSVAQEVLGSVRVVKAFGQEDREQERFLQEATRSMSAQVGVVFAEMRFGLLMALTIALGTAAVLFIGVRHVQAGVLTLGELLMVMAYLVQLYKPLETISKKITEMQASLASAARAFSLLDELPDVASSANPRPLVRAKGLVEFEAVSFSYDGERCVFEDSRSGSSQEAVLGFPAHPVQEKPPWQTSSRDFTILWQVASFSMAWISGSMSWRIYEISSPLSFKSQCSFQRQWPKTSPTAALPRPKRLSSKRPRRPTFMISL